MNAYACFASVLCTHARGRARAHACLDASARARARFSVHVSLFVCVCVFAFVGALVWSLALPGRRVICFCSPTAVPSQTPSTTPTFATSFAPTGSTASINMSIINISSPIGDGLVLDSNPGGWKWSDAQPWVLQYSTSPPGLRRATSPPGLGESQWLRCAWERVCTCTVAKGALVRECCTRAPHAHTRVPLCVSQCVQCVRGCVRVSVGLSLCVCICDVCERVCGWVCKCVLGRCVACWRTRCNLVRR